MKVKALQAALRERNLPTTGKKEVLRSRLQASMKTFLDDIHDTCGEQPAEKPGKKKTEKKLYHIPPVPRIVSETRYKQLQLKKKKEGASSSGEEEGVEGVSSAVEPSLARCRKGGQGEWGWR